MQVQNTELQREVERLGRQPAAQQAGSAGASLQVQAPQAPPSRVKLALGLQVLGLLVYMVLESWREGLEPDCEW